MTASQQKSNNDTAAPHLWLISEVKPNERRTPITPEICKKLMSRGFKISVEECPNRIVPIGEYEKVGCDIVGRGSWDDKAPLDTIIFNLKELPESDSPLRRTHIFFAHCFKYQTGWKELLHRFSKGGGKILDLEFLTDNNNRRVAAFGYMAGFAGAALGIDLWCQRLLGKKSEFNNIKDYPSEEVLVEKLKSGISAVGHLPKVLVIGALGRCGKGATDITKKCGIPEGNIIQWDLQETNGGGPFKELLDVDIVVNCIYLREKIPSFITLDMLKGEKRRLSVLVDVSCDYTSENNPFPVYNVGTTFDNPVVSVGPKDNPLDVISIDHLPTLLPLESSIRFGNDLLPTLLELKDYENSKVWQKANALYEKKLKEATSN